MLTSYFYRIFCGETFHFDIEGTRFTVHRRLVERSSDALTAMMKNGMQESLRGSAPLRDTDKYTFRRFVEFLYTGDYNPDEPVRSCPLSPTDLDASTDRHGRNEPGSGGLRSLKADIPTIELPSEPADEPAYEPTISEMPAAPAEDAWDGFFTTRKKEKQKRRVSSYNPPRLSGPTSDVTIWPPLDTASKFVPNGNWDLDYLPLFLSHAKLYIFADTYGIVNLQKLTARRFDEALWGFQYSSNSPTVIADLVEYVYEHTPILDNEVDVLQTIITNFVANNIDALRRSERFLALLRMEGPLAPAVVCKMSDRFAGSLE